MGIKDRIKRLEECNPGGSSKPPCLVVVTGGLNQEDAAAKVEATRSEYRAKYPDQVDREIDTVSVGDEETRDLISRIKERTGKLSNN